MRAILFLLVILLVSTGCRNGVQSEINVEQVIQDDALFLEFQLTIAKSSEEQATMIIPAVVGTTVFELMQIGAELDLLTLDDFSDTGGQVFIKALNGLANDAATGRYWVYYVNDKLSKVGCSSYRLEAGDQIRWSYEGSPF